ncbi:hypothetical protein OROGR_032867 [Orobanche gracilis]
MADKTDFDSRIEQIPKDFQGSDNSIPLSPQWLQPKPVENKTGAVTEDNHFSQLPSNVNLPVAVKPTGAGDDLIDNNKKKDVFRPSVLDMDSGARDRWRDEERDTNSSARKDRWEREHVDSRRVDRKADSTGRHYSEARRASGWTDSGNRDSHEQRRESKWNTRWGHDGKEADAVCEKWGDSNKEDGALLDKEPSQIPSHGKDERDGDHYRPWRPNSSYSRGRADPHNQTLTPNKPVSTFSHGRGRGENPAPRFSHGRGRVGSGGNSVTHTANHWQPHGPLIGKGEADYGEPYPRTYSRTKLIDIYRTTDMISYAKCLDGVVQVPSLMQEEPVEPLAFSAPSPDELVILKGIDKGEIISSGAPQVGKDGSAGRNTTDFMHLRRTRLGSSDDSKHETLDDPDGHSDCLEGMGHEKHIRRWPAAEVEKMQEYRVSSDQKLNADALKEDTAIHRKNDDVRSAREPSMPEHSSLLGSGLWRSSSFAERSHLTSMDIPKDHNNVWQNSKIDSPNAQKGASKWQVGDDPVMRRQPSAAAINREMETHIASHPSPEDLVLYYKDPQGEIRGPFSGSDIITWFESGYFGIELQVRLANASADSPFSLLGDVMPHLRAKARPPPGFSAPKANEIQDSFGGLNYTSFGKLHAVASEPDVLKSDPRYQHGIGSTGAENRFLESLMAGSLSSAPFEKFVLSEGMQGYGGANFIPHPPLGSNVGDDPYLFAKKLALERQRSILNPNALWPGRDAASVTANTDLMSETSLAHSKLLSSITDNASTVNNEIGGWMNLPYQGGPDPLQDKLDIRHVQNILPQSGLGLIQQRLQPQDASLNNLLAQSLDNSSRILTPEKFLTSGIPQDPQILSLLQQQYLLQQVQSQAPVASQQLSLLDMMLKQQQKQEEQQQLMLQQQQLLSQVLFEQHHNQSSGDSSFAQLQTGGLAAGNARLDLTRFQHGDIFPVGSQAQAPNMHGEGPKAADFILPPSDSQDISRKMASENSENSMLLPHQMFANTPNQRNWGASAAEPIVEQPKDFSSTTDDMNMIKMSGNTNACVSEQISKYDESVRISTTEIISSFPASEHLGESVPPQQFTFDHKNKPLFQKTVESSAETPARALKELHTGGSSVVKEVGEPEAGELKKASEKKSKKQKPSKSPSDSVRGVSKSGHLKSSESEGAISGNAKSETLAVKGDTLAASVTEKEKKTKKGADDVGFLPGQISLPALNYADDGLIMETNVRPGQVAHTSQVNMQANAGQRAWKPAPGFKPKSLLEIQQEEQRRAQEETAISDISTSLGSMSVSAPWTGVTVNADHKAMDGVWQDAASTEINMPKSDSSSALKNKNTQNEDLFWDSNVAKFDEREMEASNSGVPLTSIMISQTDSIVDDDFIDAKDTKKSRKRSAKSKNAFKTAPVAVANAVTSDKGKHARQMQQQKEVLPAPPSGPSFGDFVTWKGEPASPPAPAWPDSGKHHKPASLRDILKEQERKVPSSLPVPTTQKPATNQPARASGPSWSYSSSPTRAASAIAVHPQASSQSKHKVEDDLFWGPLEQPKQEDKQLEFPQLETQGSRGSKSTPVMGNPGGTVNRQKSTGGKPADYSLSPSASSARSSLKGKKNAVAKHSEAINFKEWCESECIRLMGSKDTSILEYCLKISRSEAETLLVENIGSLDPNHEFIDKFMSYKDFLPADVVEIAFKNQDDRKSSADMIPNHVDADGYDLGSVGAIDGATKSVGKKKGKKGKKVNASVLGFNVVSNRIMMGEIQTVDE